MGGERESAWGAKLEGCSVEEQQGSRTTLFAVDVRTGYMELRKRNLDGDVE